MTIKQAKEDIKNAVSVYLTKDKFGNLVIPIEKQRPIFMMGSPGIGKTDIMKQIAEELKIGLVSYSMTHHTRQSALGLPFIVHKNYGGQEYSISEYTMSEIIASVYDAMENTGIKEGILFLDEINCVSETLAPAMLQFLQYKIFGRHKIPDGWVVVTAGNPPEFNKSVREFDIVTWDRLKRLDVEADYDTWKEYAYTKGVHAAITTYLDIKKDDFYRIESTVDGKVFATARGWSDLSDMMKLYEEKGLTVNEQLIAQYLQHKKIAKQFAIYYDLYNKYKSDYQVDKILKGQFDKDILDRAKDARFDERLSLLGLLIDSVTDGATQVYKLENKMIELMNCLKPARKEFNQTGKFVEAIVNQIEAKRKEIEVGKKASNLSAMREYTINSTIEALNEIKLMLNKAEPKDADMAFNLINDDFKKRKSVLENLVSKSGDAMSNMFKFCEQVFDENGQELLIVVTELTINPYTTHFISKYNCAGYYKHNKKMMFYERKKEIASEIENLNLDEVKATNVDLVVPDVTSDDDD